MGGDKRHSQQSEAEEHRNERIRAARNMEKERDRDRETDRRGNIQTDRQTETERQRDGQRQRGQEGDKVALGRGVGGWGECDCKPFWHSLQGVAAYPPRPLTKCHSVGTQSRCVLGCPFHTTHWQAV